MNNYQTHSTVNFKLSSVTGSEYDRDRVGRTVCDYSIFGKKYPDRESEKHVAAGQEFTTEEIMLEELERQLLAALDTLAQNRED